MNQFFGFANATNNTNRGILCNIHVTRYNNDADLILEPSDICGQRLGAKPVTHSRPLCSLQQLVRTLAQLNEENMFSALLNNCTVGCQVLVNMNPRGSRLALKASQIYGGSCLHVSSINRAYTATNGKWNILLCIAYTLYNIFVTSNLDGSFFILKFAYGKDSGGSAGLVIGLDGPMGKVTIPIKGSQYSAFVLLQ